MCKVICKPGVRFKGFGPAMMRLLTALTDLAEYGTGLPEQLVITSANDSTHSPRSRHYRNEAIDIRSRNFPTRKAKRAFREMYERALGPKFRVLFEGDGTPNEHFHAQVKKGQRYP